MEIVVEALADGPMTRRELTERMLPLKILGKKAKLWFEQSWWGVVREAVVEGLICYVPGRDHEVTLVRVDQWLPKQRKVRTGSQTNPPAPIFARLWSGNAPGFFSMDRYFDERRQDFWGITARRIV
jgi:hypothetical protein